MASGIQHLALHVTSRHSSHSAARHFKRRLAQYQCRCPQIRRSLIQCQHSKMYRYTITPTGYFSPPDTQFDLVHHDIVGPLPSAKDNMHLLTCVHTVALGHTIARHFHSQSYKPFMGWIAQLFGVPTTLMSDRVGVEGNLSQMSATT